MDLKGVYSLNVIQKQSICVATVEIVILQVLLACTINVLDLHFTRVVTTKATEQVWGYGRCQAALQALTVSINNNFSFFHDCQDHQEMGDSLLVIQEVQCQPVLDPL